MYACCCTRYNRGFAAARVYEWRKRNPLKTIPQQNSQRSGSWRFHAYKKTANSGKDFDASVIQLLYTRKNSDFFSGELGFNVGKRVYIFLCRTQARME